jgi:cellulose synthase/poly-beta-1,6-N-acetylglucosamine synthase-like glycosyltransferase
MTGSLSLGSITLGFVVISLLFTIFYTKQFPLFGFYLKRISIKGIVAQVIAAVALLILLYVVEISNSWVTLGMRVFSSSFLIGAIFAIAMALIQGRY